MNLFEEPGQRNNVSIPSLIAWLSLCILAAAWGRSLDERWQSIWASAGMFGLTAAVGLGIIERARIAHRSQARAKALQSRADFGLARLNEEGATRGAISVALRRLHDQVAERGTAGFGPNDSRQPADKECIRSELPVRITPVVDLDDENCELGTPVHGVLREISLRCVSFIHAKPFIGRIAVLTFKIGEHQQISFVTDVMWTESMRGGFISGGTVLDVGVPCAEGHSKSSVVPAQVRPSETVNALAEVCAAEAAGDSAQEPLPVEL